MIGPVIFRNGLTGPIMLLYASLMTTTQTASPATVEMVRKAIEGQTPGRQAQFAQYLRDPEMTQARAMNIIRQLSGTADDATTGDLPKERRNNGGSNASSHGSAPAATERQIWLARKLVSTKLVGFDQAGEMAKIHDGMSRVAVSAIIDKLINKPDLVATDDNRATDRQVSYLNSLRTERGSEPLTDAQVAALTKSQAKADIDAWLLIPRPARTAAAVLEPGMYRVGDDVFKVQKSRQSGWMYAKRLVVHGPGEASFEYDSGAIRKITPDDLMSLEEAQQFGRLTGVCCQCGAELTNEESIRLGIGPICRSKF